MFQPVHCVSIGGTDERGLELPVRNPELHPSFVTILDTGHELIQADDTGGDPLLIEVSQ